MIENTHSKSMIKEILGSRRDANRETEVCRALRNMPESHRYNELIKYLSEVDDLTNYNKCSMILQMANRCLESKEYFLRLFNFGLDFGDLSSIKFWIEWISPRLGLNRIIKELINNLSKNPGGVEAAHYWIRQKYLKAFYSESAEKHLIELESIMGDKGDALNL